jgi:hypothetical protein
MAVCSDNARHLGAVTLGRVIGLAVSSEREVLALENLTP